MKFNEKYTVEKPIIDFLVNELGFEYSSRDDFSSFRDSNKEYIVTHLFKKALIALNPNIGEYADSVIQKVRDIHTNKEFLPVLREGVAIPNLETGQTETYRLLDFETPENNHFVVTNQFYFEGSMENIRPDIVVFVNGFPLVVIEAKSPVVAHDVSFENGINQINRYEKYARNLFIPNAFNIATDGITTVYGATGASKQDFWHWKSESRKEGDDDMRLTLRALLEKGNLLDIVRNFILFEDTAGGAVKKIARYQQLRAVNRIVDCVVSRRNKQGLIWHTQGSGKTLTMFFTAWKLRYHPELNNPVVFVLVDRVDLDNQMYEVFTNAGGKNVIRVSSKRDLEEKIQSSDRGIYITTIQKFSDLKENMKKLDENVIILSDEAHRGDEGKSGIRMRSSFPNAFFFGFTGTPIDKKNINTFRNYGEEGKRYLDYYSIQQAIDDGATVPVTYEARLSKFFVDEEMIEDEFNQVTEGLTKEEKNQLAKRHARVEKFVKRPDRMRAIAHDIVEHYKTYVEPNGFKAQIVAYNREAVVGYKEILDKIVGAECSAAVISSDPEDSDDMRKYYTTKHQREEIIKSFKDKDSPLKFLIVRDMLLTGFDAPIEEVMYLDRPLRDHGLLQAIARTNRVYTSHKKEGRVIDYYGITRNLTNALDFDEEIISSALVDMGKKKEEFIRAFGEVMDIFSDVNMEDPSIPNLQKCLNRFIGNEELQKRFKEQYTRTKDLYEFLSPDAFLGEYERRFGWVTGMYIAFLKKFNDKSDWKILDEYGEKVKKLIRETKAIDFEGVTKNFRNMRIGDIGAVNKLEDMEEKEKALELERMLRFEISENINENPSYRTFGERLSDIKNQFEQGQIDLFEKIRQCENLRDDIKKENERVQEMGLDLKEYGLFFILKEQVPDTEESVIIDFVKDMNNRLADILDTGWQSSILRDEFIRKIKQLLQKMILTDYKDKISVAPENVQNILNKMTDIIEDKL